MELKNNLSYYRALKKQLVWFLFPVGGCDIDRGLWWTANEKYVVSVYIETEAFHLSRIMW